MKVAVIAAFLLSSALCLHYELHTRAQIRTLRASLERERAELRSVGNVDAEVTAFQAKKAAVRKWAATNAAAISTIDAAAPPVEIARVVNDDTIEVRTAAGTATLQVKR